MQETAPRLYLTPIAAGSSTALHIGQHVAHHDYKGQRCTGIVQGLTIDNDRGLMVHCVLDEPLVIPADQHGPEIRSYHLHAQAHEFAPLTVRDELLAEALDLLQTIVRQCGARLDEVSGNLALLSHAKAVIAKVSGARE